MTITMMMKNTHKKVIITGVTGQDGSYMADHLLEATDYEIFGMIRRTSTNNNHNIN
jgi:GDPmannose 4,6-dehydratase